MPARSSFAWRASPGSPCPVCGRNKSCDSADLALYQCITRTSDVGAPVPGFIFTGVSQLGWGLWLREDAPPNGSRSRHETNGHANGFHPATAKIESRPPPWATLVPLFVQVAQAGGHVERLAADLGVSIDSLAAVSCGWTPAFWNGCWAFPEEDGLGNIAGIGFRLTRLVDGKNKRQYPGGGHRGIIVPTDLERRIVESPVAPGVLLAVEGPTDVAACLTMGIAAVGRPNDTGGGVEIARMLGRLQVPCQLVVLVENDRKPDGSWKGQAGALRCHRNLLDALGGKLPERQIGLKYMPEGAKDPREFLLTSGLKGVCAGEELMKRIICTEDVSIDFARLYSMKGNGQNGVPVATTPFPSLLGRRAESIDTINLSNLFGETALRIVAEGAEAGRCPRRPVPLLVEKEDEWAVCFLGVDCRCWVCPVCLYKRRLKWLLHLTARLAEAESLGLWQGDDGQFKTFRRFCSRHGADFVRVATTAGLVVLTTAPAGQFVARPVTPIDLPTAANRLADALADVDRDAAAKGPVNASVPWSLDEHKKSGKYTRDGQLTPGRFRYHVDVVTQRYPVRLKFDGELEACFWRHPNTESVAQVRSFRMRLKEDL